MSGTIYFADNMEILPNIPDESVDLIYIDPPFNTGKTQKHTTLRTVRDDEGDRVGYQGQRYKTVALGTRAYADQFDDFMGFLGPRLEQAYRILKPSGSLFVHLDYREVHYCKVYLDGIFGRDCFINEIIWAYDFGARSKTRWSAKHDNILWYVKNPKNYTFHYDQIERIPYMAPGLVGKEKAERGKTLTDCWWSTIVPTNGKERTGYPTQKPMRIVERIVAVHSNPGELVLDFFAGSGTTGEAAAKLERDFIMIDENPESIEVMKERLAFASPQILEKWEPSQT